MTTLLVLYPTPTDLATFQRRYEAEHAPMVAEHFPGVTFRALRVVGSPGGQAPYTLVAELGFESAESMQKLLATPGGQATAAHANEISSGGAPVFLVCESAS
jgi:uncharacterized protein (TIGR02118 family)